jgi:hypothetical protein
MGVFPMMNEMTTGLGESRKANTCMTPVWDITMDYLELMSLCDRKESVSPVRCMARSLMSTAFG